MSLFVFVCVYLFELNVNIIANLKKPAFDLSNSKNNFYLKTIWFWLQNKKHFDHELWIMKAHVFSHMILTSKQKAFWPWIMNYESSCVFTSMSVSTSMSRIWYRATNDWITIVLDVLFWDLCVHCVSRNLRMFERLWHGSEKKESQYLRI